MIDARLDNNMHELYESRTGGESWSLKQATASPIRIAACQGRENDADGACAPTRRTRSFDIEKSDGARWQKVASFLVNVGACKQ